MDIDEEIALLSRSRLFRDCDADDLEVLAYTAVPVSFTPGETIIHQNIVADHAYYVFAGQVRLQIAGGQLPQGFAEMGDSLLLGVVSAIAGRATPWNVVALDEVQALSWPVEDLRRFLLRVPAVSVFLLEHLTGQMVDHMNALFAAQAEGSKQD
ncbi:MAG: cyclic nucleotide-binding domain-containing protein [Pseudomonadota bacterium]